MKKLLCIILAFTLVCGLFAGCSGNGGNTETAAPNQTEAPAETEAAAAEPTEAADGEAPSVGFVMMGMGTEFFEGIVNVFFEVFEGAGWDADYVSGDYDNTKIVEGIENFAAMGKDVIIVFPMSGEAISAAVSQARAAGSKVICMVEASSEWDGYLSSDHFATGMSSAWMAAQWIEENYADAEPGSVPIALVNTLDTPTNAEMSEGLDAITDYTDKVYVAATYETAGQTNTDGQQAAESLYATNPEIQLFLTTSNAIALGINTFYTAINSPVDDLSGYGAWGTNSSQEVLDAIVDSRDNSSIVRGINVQAGLEETGRCFLYLAEGLVDGSIEKEEIPATVYLVNADNVDQYMADGEVSLQWDYENAVGVEVSD